LGKIHSTYNVVPSFTHVDKDFAEISALATVWPSTKPQICMWHLQQAISERLAKPSLKTTSYNVTAARAEFGFIDSNHLIMKSMGTDLMRSIYQGDPKREPKL